MNLENQAFGRRMFQTKVSSLYCSNLRVIILFNLLYDFKLIFHILNIDGLILYIPKQITYVLIFVSFYFCVC